MGFIKAISEDLRNSNATLPVEKELEVTTVTRGVGVQDSFGVTAQFEGDGVRGLDRWFSPPTWRGWRIRAVGLDGGCC